MGVVDVPSVSCFHITHSPSKQRVGGVGQVVIPVVNGVPSK